MASFVQTSTLLRTAVRNGDGTVTVFDPPQTITAWRQYVASVEDAMALLAPAERPPAEQWGGYTLTYAFRAYLEVSVRGVVPDRDLLVVDLALWSRRQDRQQPPPIRDTLVQQVTARQRVRDVEAQVRASLDAMLLGHTQRGTDGDFRDLALVTTTDPAHDPAGLLARADVQRVDGASINYQ